MVKALFPDDAVGPQINIIKRGVEDFFGGNVKTTLLNMTTSGLFLFLPIVFSAVMGIAGVRAVAAATALSSSLSSGGQVIKGAARGTQTVGNIATSKLPIKGK